MLEIERFSSDYSEAANTARQFRLVQIEPTVSFEVFLPLSFWADSFNVMNMV